MPEHLNRNSISALLDDPEGVPGGLDHLAECEDCAHEYEQMSRMRMALSGLPDLDPPPDEWSRVQAELGFEPLGRGLLAPVWRKASSWPLQAAAVVALFAAGLMVGQSIATDDAAAPGIPRAADNAGSDDRTGTQNGMLDVEPTDAYLRTVADLEALRDLDLGANSLRADPEGMAERITHLDAMIEASSEALREAPADPVLNNFLFQLVDEREKVAGQLVQTLRMTAAEY
jgi:hypothetical protein